MKKYILTGFVILLPIALTLMIISFLFDLFTEPFVTIVAPLVNLIQNKSAISLPHGIVLFISRILSMIFLCIFIFILGVITRWFLVKTLIGWADKILFKIPFIRTVYRVSRDIFIALFSSDGKKTFKRTVTVPFPTRPNYCIGFASGEIADECQKKVQTPLTPVFVPTAPHPISGFLILVPEVDVHNADMSNEEVVKFLVSCGMATPNSEPHPNPSNDHPN